MKKLILLSLLLVGCKDQNSPESLKQTDQSFQNPQLVGTLPDGRKVKMAIRNMGSLKHDHYIYFVDNVSTVNEAVQQGKSSYNSVRAFIPAENDSK